MGGGTDQENLNNQNNNNININDNDSESQILNEKKHDSQQQMSNTGTNFYFRFGDRLPTRDSKSRKGRKNYIPSA
jgi:hypothetical protein